MAIEAKFDERMAKIKNINYFRIPILNSIFNSCHPSTLVRSFLSEDVMEVFNSLDFRSSINFLLFPSLFLAESFSTLKHYLAKNHKTHYHFNPGSYRAIQKFNLPIFGTGISGLLMAPFRMTALPLSLILSVPEFT